MWYGIMINAQIIGVAHIMFILQTILYWRDKGKGTNAVALSLKPISINKPYHNRRMAKTRG